MQRADRIPVLVVHRRGDRVVVRVGEDAQYERVLSFRCQQLLAFYEHVPSVPLLKQRQCKLGGILYQA